VDVADYLPFDSLPNARRMLAALRPAALVFSKLDVWPLLCEEASAADVRLGLVSGTLSASAGRRRPAGRALLGDAYRALDAVGAIAAADATRLAELGARPDRIQVTGDTRYDQVWQRARALESALRGESGALNPQILAALSRLQSSRPTLVAGSTWPSDESVLMPAWAEVRESVPLARLIVAPHEPSTTHLAALDRCAGEHSLSVARFGAPDVADADVVLVDEVGVLAELYSLGSAAYVGGGFHRAGLHSVLEPAALGVPVLFGPLHANSRDAGLLLEADGAVVVRDHQDASDGISHWLASPEAARAAGRAARDLVQAGLGAAERTFALVEGLLAGIAPSGGA
jgi:3-deoxy-D-manno-octulosonic-acid transferase